MGYVLCTETSKAPPRTSKHTTMPQASAPKHPATPADIGSLCSSQHLLYTRNFLYFRQLPIRSRAVQ